MPLRRKELCPIHRSPTAAAEKRSPKALERPES